MVLVTVKNHTGNTVKIHNVDIHRNTFKGVTVEVKKENVNDFIRIATDVFGFTAKIARKTKHEKQDRSESLDVTVDKKEDEVK